VASPWLLLSMTFALGIGAALNAPAWQAITPELVPAEELPPAVALSGVGLNLARAIGPALGGLLVAAAGPGFVFLLNAASFLGVMAVLRAWRRPPSESALPAERMLGALRAGIRFTRHSTALRSVVLRGGIFAFFGSAVLALLPLLARHTL